MPKANTCNQRSLYDGKRPHPSGQTKRKTETEFLFALAEENEHQMYPSLFPPCLFSVPLSYLSFLKFFQIGF